MGNQQGKERRDFGRRIDWSNAERPSPPGKPFLVPEDGNRPTDVITIRWSPPVTDGGAPLLGYLVEHRRTGSPHWLRATPELVRGTELPLTGLEPGWRYQFRVSAENDIGRSDPGELSEPLTVTPQKWAASAPFFNIELQDTIGLENEKVEFKVQVIAVPPPTIAWYKDGFEVFSSRRTKIVTENDQSTFIIHQAALQDEGEIKCTATNRAGYAVTKANLKLEAPPRLRLPRQYEDGMIFEKGELIRLKATTAGRPKPQVNWYHNGELLERTDRVEVVDSETGSMLRISDACRSDRGEYMIKGVNKIGEDFVSFLVTVADRPSPPGKPQATIFGRTVTLSWSEPEDDGGCKIGSYLVEYFRVGWEMWLKAKNSRQLSTILEDLIEGSEYRFRIRAENPYGVSDPSEESDVVFVPDPKRGIFQPPPRRETSGVLSEAKRSLEKNEGIKRHQGHAEEAEESKRRRLLEEKARRLLDTPLPVLLNKASNGTTAKSVESMNDENVPPPVPKRRKAKGRLTPSPVDGGPSDLRITPTEETAGKGSLTPSPILGKSFKTEELRNGPVKRTEKELEEQNQQQTAMRFTEQDPFCGEGPMYPRENDDSISHGSSELMLVIYPRDRSKSVELSAQQRSEIEMSLAEDAVAPPMSLSAPELGCTEIFEQPLTRNAVSSTELLYERTAARLYQDNIDEEAQRMVKRRYSMDRKSVERRASLKEPLEKRLSFKGPQDEQPSDGAQHPAEPHHQPREEIQTKIPKPLNKTARERLSSVERERLEFALVRDRLKRKEEEQKSRLGVINHESEPSTATPTSSSVDMEDLDDEYEDSVEEEEEEDYLDKNEKETDEDFDDDISDIKSELSRIPVIDSSLTLPRPIRIAPFAEREEDTYHPRSMIPTRSVIAKLPVEEVRTVTQPKAPIPEAPRPTSPSQPQTEPTKTKIPISKPKKTSNILKKLCLKKEKKIPEVLLTPADQDSPPTVLPKPILKNKTPAKKKDSPKALLKLSHSKPSDRSVSEEESESEVGRKKKQVRIAEPNEQPQKQREEALVDKNARENQVLIYHYSDIVKEFGGHKKPPVRLYLDCDELKAHAEPEKLNSFPNQIKPVNVGKAVLEKKEKIPEVTKPETAVPQENPSQPEVKLHSSFEYLIDVIMFIVACFLYLFKNELYAVPVLAIMVYRQLKDMTLEKYRKIKASAADLIPKKFQKNNDMETTDRTHS